ncbi:MAG: NFACT RNA binding domain-containing protein [Cyclobacteriaceae bacterium]|nr:NFACT RNA binding domain-containing protein [Cyclobacteriaceae bacterium]
MFHHFVFIRRLAYQLHEQLQNATLGECFSQQKDELILGFLLPDKSSFYIRASLSAEVSLLSFPADYARARKNSVDLFAELIGRRVIQVVPIPFDRSFLISFSRDFQLLFKMHGSRSNLALFKNDKLFRLFNTSLAADLQLSPATLSRPIDLSQPATIELGLLEKIIGKEWMGYLILQYDYTSLTNQEKIERIRETLNIWLSSPIRIEKSHKPTLSLLPGEGLGLASPIEAANQLYSLYTRDYFLEKEKSRAESLLRQKIKQSLNYIEKTSQKAREIEQRRDYGELANLLMANLHQLSRNKSEVTVEDIYHDNRPIVIRVKPNLSPQQNAEQYYRKAKNQKKELEVLKANIEAKKEQLQALEKECTELAEATTFKELRKRDNAASKKENVVLPYKPFEFQGYHIWVGKSARANDELTLHHAHKNDLWLHARDVAGSHVIIKTQAGKTTPATVLEYAARLAAANSKRKTDSLCPVIYTEKKHIRKPRGFPPGKVIVEKENVLMVEPLR